MIKHLALIALLSTAGTARAKGEFRSVQDLLYDCHLEAADSFKNGTHYGRCIGYLEAVFDAASLIHACPSGAITYGQEMAIFTNWAQRNPKTWREYQLFGVIQAYQEAWPCK